jgi:proteasome lid subunit RPN8/RPN11
MNFSIAKTIRRLLAPRHELSCPWLLWRSLCVSLRQRGRARTRESGAFLLGRLEADGRRRVTDYVLYDDLDPACLDSGIVRFDGHHFGALWALCKARDLIVVADIHVHPGAADQSDSDRAHPMISQRGHIALILPNFAAQPLPRMRVGIYKYQGAKRWTVIAPQLRNDFFHIGI